jgi:hypothetical protein
MRRPGPGSGHIGHCHPRDFDFTAASVARCAQKPVSHALCDAVYRALATSDWPRSTGGTSKDATTTTVNGAWTVLVLLRQIPLQLYDQRRGAPDRRHRASRHHGALEAAQATLLLLLDQHFNKYRDDKRLVLG